MKQFARLVIITVIAAGVFAASANAQQICCCNVLITGNTMSCGGFYIPNATVELVGPLRDTGSYAPYLCYSDGHGSFAFVDTVPLGNYWDNQLYAWASLQIGEQTILYYWGVSTTFDVNCFVIGQVVQVSFNIPMWII